MLDPEVTAVITGAAGNAVAYMLSGRLDALRAWVGRVYRSSSDQQRSEQLHAIENDADALTRRIASESDVRARWALALGMHLAAHPESRIELEEMAAAVPTATRTMYVREQHNHGSGAFVGGDNHGWINGPSREE